MLLRKKNLFSFPDIGSASCKILLTALTESEFCCTKEWACACFVKYWVIPLFTELLNLWCNVKL